MSEGQEIDAANKRQLSGEKVGIVLLAAGASTRLGKPKQLLPLQGQTLLERTARTAMASCCDPAVVVLGAYAEKVRPELNALGIRIVENPQWSEGMSSSIRAGLEALTAGREEIAAVIFLVCDQPFVTPELIDRLVSTYYRTGAPIVASEYGGNRGVPALFARSLFPELMTLQGTAGAKQVIANHASEVVSFPFPEGELDIDTQADYERARSSVPESVIRPAESM